MKPIKECWCGVIAEGDTDQCASHNAADRKTERQAAKMQIVSPVKKVTAKRAGQNQEYLKLRKEYLVAFPCCEVEECNLKSVEIHHQKGRENERLLDTNYFMAVCQKHHGEIHSDSAASKEKGHMITRSTKI